MGMILNVLGALVIGAIGWLTVEFFGRPVRDFFDLRRRVRTQMLRFDAMPVLPDDDGLFSSGTHSAAHKMQATLHDLSDELISFGQSEWLAAKFVRRLGFHPIVAGQNLATLAIEYGTVIEDRSANCRAVLKALKYPIV
jgi:hypothetical protein